MLTRILIIIKEALDTPIRFDKLVKIDKISLSNFFFCIGVWLAFFDSLHPWFLWPLGPYANIFIVFFLACGLFINATLKKKSEPNRHYLLPFTAYTILIVYQFFIGPVVTFMAFVTTALKIATFYLVFRMNEEQMRKAIHCCRNTMAVLLLVSMVAFVPYLLGIGMPCVPAVFGDNLYSYDNYFFFMIDDRALMEIIPRFNSVFLEPSHMGIAACFLLMCEVGNWRKWYNIVFIIAVCISFSAESYLLLFCLVFASKWIQKKNFVRNLMIVIIGFSSIIIGSFFYNNGENMLNQLIVMRFEVDDGDVAGNNRTSETFDSEYESYLSSSDVFTGREMSETWGNSGYKVFVYENGLIGVFLLFTFYLIIFGRPKNNRAMLTAAALWVIHFVIRAHMTWASTIILMYYMAQMYEVNNGRKQAEQISE